MGDLEEVNAHDILLDEEDASIVIKPGDHVIGLHPKYQYAYAPGRVVDVEQDGALNVEFYDGKVAVVPRVETYFITPLKFHSDCKCYHCLYALLSAVIRVELTRRSTGRGLVRPHPEAENWPLLEVCVRWETSPSQALAVVKTRNH